jgi:myo-inositol 2-dehydrogenase / D-chiro-inositol 1-dehydrogenase
VETGHTSTVVCHLGNISLRLGRKLFWDPKKEVILNDRGYLDHDANRWLGREYRTGFELPKVEPPAVS